MKLAFVFPGQGSQAVGMLKGYDGLPEMAELAVLPGEVRHLFTHVDLTVTVLRGKAVRPGGEGIWTPPERFGELALPALTKKLLRHAGLAG